MSASSSSNLVDKVVRIKISRGLNDEVTVDPENFEDYNLFDKSNLPIRFHDIYKEKKTIIVFLRCFAAKEYMEDLATIPDGVLQQANVQLVAVVPSMPELLSVFKEETGFRHALYCDPSANIYRKIGFKCGVVPHDQYPVNNKHVKSSWMLGVLRSTYRTAVLYRDFNADMLVNGGCLVLGPGRQLHCSHLDNGMFDQMPINSLLERVCGVTMSFPKDRRVLHL
uniref:Thioredoxin-like protein AAED1 n=1 Tax=Macrostomum lignano TaxID=282301 RepID=A0A1I8HR23_9PLAT